MRCRLSFDDHIEPTAVRGVGEGVIGVGTAIEREARGDQRLEVDLVRPGDVERHRRADTVDQSGGDDDITALRALQIVPAIRSSLMSRYSTVPKDSRRRGENIRTRHGFVRLG